MSQFFVSCARSCDLWMTLQTQLEEQLAGAVPFIYDLLLIFFVYFEVDQAPDLVPKQAFI